MTLVCEAWLPAARKALYKTIAPEDVTQAMLVYEELRHNALSLGHFVECMDLQVALKDSPQSLKIWTRISDFIPNVTSISLDIRDCKALSKHPVWQKITQLQVSDYAESEEAELVELSESLFPPKLQTLHMRGLASILGGRDWRKVRLPELEYLVLQDSSWLAHVHVPGSCHLPRLPRLRRVKVIRPRGLESEIVGLLKKLAPQIRHLEFDSVEEAERLLDPSFLCSFTGLVTFVFNGVITPRFELRKLENLFPLSLRELQLTWEHNTLFGEELMRLLKDEPKFLPNLVNCPSLTFRTRTSDAPLPTESTITKLIHQSIKTHTALQTSRPWLNMMKPFYLPMPVDEHFFLLPTPIGYRTLILTELANVLSDAAEQGDIVPMVA